MPMPIPPAPPSPAEQAWQQVQHYSARLREAADRLEASGGVRRATRGMGPAGLERAALALHSGWEVLDELCDQVEAARLRRRPVGLYRQVGRR